jgi:aminoglycoside phosphotransferase (APT) family kinase protein
VASLTHVRLSRDHVGALTRSMLGSSARVERIGALRGGMIHTCIGIRLSDGCDLVLKIAPPPSYVGLTCEHEAMRAEIDFLGRAAEAGIPVPALVAVDFSRTVIGSDCFLMRRLPGRSLQRVRRWLSQGALRGVRRQLGRAVARIASIRGSTFGHTSPGAGTAAPTWREAYTNMVRTLLHDAARLGVTLPVSHDAIAALVFAAAPTLDAVLTPSLVHFDLWDGNIMIDLSGSGPRLSGLLDPEHALWGDPYAEFASLALYRDIERDEALLSAWAEASGRPVVFDRVSRVRVLLGQLYLYLLQFIDPVAHGLPLLPRLRLQLPPGYWLRRVIKRLARAVALERP